MFERTKSKEVFKIYDYFKIDEAFNKVSTANEDNILENCTVHQVNQLIKKIQVNNSVQNINKSSTLYQNTKYQI